MKRIYSSVCFSVLLIRAMGSGWVDSTLFSPKLFIENKGQFNRVSFLPSGFSTLFAVNHSKTKIFFSKNKVAFTLVQRVRDEEAFRRFQKEEGKGGPQSQQELEEEENLQRKIFKTRTASVFMEWIGADANCTVEASRVANEYFNYGMDKDIRHDINFVKGYKKLVYRDIYPGVDIEYTFHEKSGIKYDLIVHPGADISKIKLKYSGAKNISLDDENNVLIQTAAGNIIDHAPVSFQGSGGKKIQTKFILTGSMLSFVVDDYDEKQTLTIDPWVSPTAPQLDTAYEVATDPAGNVYVYGDFDSQVKKYNNAGVAQWTFLSGPGYLYNATLIGGDLAVDPPGNSYVSGSECVRKLSPGGVSLWLYAPTRNITNISCCETGWRMVFDPATNRLYGAGSNGQTKATWYDVNTGNPMWLPNGWNACNIISGPCPSACPNANGEFRHITRAPNGNFYGYTAVGDGAGSNNVSTITGFDPNFVSIYRSCNVPPSPYWTIPFQPTSPTYYVGCYYMGNGIAASNCFIYIYTGSQVQKFDIYAPTFLGSANIAGGVQYMNSGILSDLMNNFYVGTQNGISVYSPSFNLITSVATSKPVYDMAFAPGNNIAACGIGFVGVFANLVQTGTAITCPVSPNLPMTAAADSTPVTGCNNANGMAWVDTIMNGTGPYTFSWSTGATNDTISGLGAGTYTCTIIDSSCPKETTTVVITITSSAVPQSNIAITKPLCNGGNNGSASATMTGGTGPYTYAWSPSGGNSSAATGLSAGNYTVTITDGSGCTATNPITITQPAAISAVSSSTQASCGNNNGTASVSASGGTSPYTFAWLSGQTTSAISNLGAGSYFTTITDANGCTKTATVTVSSSSGITVLANSTPSSCSAATGTASANPSGGSIPYSYLWNNGQTSQTASGLSAGTYTVTVTDANGCTAITTANVTQPSTINSTASALPDTCSKNVGTAAAITTGGVTPYSYAWSNGQTTSAISNLSAGNYSVTVTDANGCSLSSIVTVGNSGGAVANAGIDVSISVGDSTVLSASGGINYSWSTGETINPISVSPSATTTYIIIVTNASGCTDADTVIVYVIEPITDCSEAENPDLFALPNAFSPNSDTQNDRFHLLYGQLLNDCVKEFYIAVYNRWGEKIYEGTTINFSWDGNYKDKAEETTAFAWYMNVILTNDVQVKKKGNITLLR